MRAVTRSRRSAGVAFAAGSVLVAVPLAARLLSLDIGSRAAVVCSAMGVVALIAGATLRWRVDLCDSAPRALRHRYFREFTPPMLGYVAVMLFWKRLLASVDTTWLRVAVAVLPAIMVLLALRAIMRYVRDSDEMQRRIELESIALAAGFTSAAFLTAGFLQSAKLLAVQGSTAMLMVFPAICLAYGLAKLVIARRYA